MSAPEHRVFLWPIKLLLSDAFQREQKALIAQNPGVGFAGPGSIDIPVDLSPDVVSIQTQKDLTITSAGSFEIRLVDAMRFGVGWRQGKTASYTVNIQPNDIIRIDLNAGDQRDQFVPVMLGVVSAVSKDTHVSDNKVSHYIVVQGYDLGYWLIAHRNFFWLYAIGPGGQVAQGIKEVRRRLNPALEGMNFYLIANTAIPADEVIERLLIERGVTNPNFFPSVPVIDKANKKPGYISAQFPRIYETFSYLPVPSKSRRAKGTIAGFKEAYFPWHTLDAFYGSVVNILDRFSFRPFAQLWGDINDQGGFTIYFRRSPWDQEDWTSFRPMGEEEDPTRRPFTVSDAEIVSASIGRSDRELVNFMSVLPRFYGATTETDLIRLFLPHTLRLDWASIKDRGYRPSILSTEYLDFITDEGGISVFPQQDFHSVIAGEGNLQSAASRAIIPASQSVQVRNQFMQGKGRLAEMANEWVDVLWDWYSRMDDYYGGRIRVKGQPAIRVGHKVELPSETRKHFAQAMGFFVSSVRHEYEVEAGHFLTSLGLVRGQAKDGFIRPVTDGKEDIPEGDRAKLSSRIVDRRSLHLEIFVERERRR